MIRKSEKSVFEEPSNMAVPEPVRSESAAVEPLADTFPRFERTLKGYSEAVKSSFANLVEYETFGKKEGLAKSEVIQDTRDAIYNHFEALVVPEELQAVQYLQKSKNRENRDLSSTGGKKDGEETQGTADSEFESTFKSKPQNKHLSDKMDKIISKMKFLVGDPLKLNADPFKSSLETKIDQLANLVEQMEIKLNQNRETTIFDQEHPKDLKKKDTITKETILGAPEPPETSIHLKNPRKPQTAQKPKKRPKTKKRSKSTAEIENLEAEANSGTLKLKVTQLREHQREDKLIGGYNTTLLAMKDKDSYLIASENLGYKLYNQSQLVSSGELPCGGQELYGLFYCKPQSAYYLFINQKLYKKEISAAEPSLVINIQFGAGLNRGFQYSEVSRRLVAIKEVEGLAVVDLDSRLIEVDCSASLSSKICDLKLLGESEEVIAVLNKLGMVVLINYDVKNRSYSIVQNLRFHLKKDREECPLSLEVMQESGFLCAQLIISESVFVSSRFLIFEFNEAGLCMRGIYDVLKASPCNSMALGWLGALGGSQIFFRFAVNEGGDVGVFSFDQRTGRVRELPEKRVGHEESCVFSLVRFENSFYYTGTLGRLMRLDFEY